MSSFVMSALKSVQEKIPENYSSYEILTTLDTLLLNAVKPLLLYTKFLDRNLSILSGWYINTARRKVASQNTKEDFVTLIAALIIAPKKERLTIWKTLKLERTIVFWLLQNWLDIMKNWPKYHASNDNDALLSCERKACLLTNENVFQLMQRVDYWFNKAVTFKQSILEKYMRLAMLEASAYCTFQKNNNPHLQIDVNDVSQNFILAVSKAIDKCDADKGTLTSYVKTWLQDARNSASGSHEYGTAFYVPTSKKREIARKESTINNLSLSIESDEVLELESADNVEHAYETLNTVNRVRALAKEADPLGLGRIALKITEVLTPGEVALLLEEAKNEQKT